MMDVLYTLAPIALAESEPIVLKELTCGGVTVSARQLAEGRYQIVQVLSTQPEDFLRADVAPGTVIRR